jgi:Tol biopolymer transport system component
MRSHLAVFRIDNGSLETVLTTSRHIEAPNWCLDDAALIVNGAGRLYRVPLANPELQEIDTGFANRINNDHGVSPDGKSLVVSDATESGASCLYTLPVSGGAPKRVTELTPSYWHGWSPDGATLAYVGKRGTSFQVYTCPAGGGAERQLTADFDHCDGPDYTPDGRWIWFNGEKSGAVDLWRMRPDGSDLERMTSDAEVNWFPHPSPDGQCVLYLAYRRGTRGHPAMQSVELRTIPVNGGEPTTLLRLTGGQGTINVPCWAPDGRRFAFVQYED